MLRPRWVALRPSQSVKSEYRRIRLVLFAFISLFFILFLWTQCFTLTSVGLSQRRPLLSQVATPRRARLHLLIPATSSNEDLCKLLLSVEILGYPTPILVNYGAAEQEDPYVQHLAKVDGLLKYIKGIQDVPGNPHTHDLVLIVDGYDLWMQLRPDVLIQRYFAMQDAFNLQAQQIYGSHMVEQYRIRQTVIFGPDKVCWPIDFSRPACWAVPDTPLAKDAFGPYTQATPYAGEPNMPQWLNSGTILGPVNDLATLLAATLDRIQTRYTINSDQLYLADLWGEQEYARLSLLGQGAIEAARARDNGPNITKLDPEPLPVPGPSSELGIGVDYRSAMFQTISYYEAWLVWSRAISLDGEEDDSPRRPGVDGLGTPLARSGLPVDIERSLAPPTSQSATDTEKNWWGGIKSQSLGWRDVSLFHNTATGEVPVMVHFTGNKSLRQGWWGRMWYQPMARVLREGALRDKKATKGQRALSMGVVGGMWWFAADADGGSAAGGGGAWSDQKQWLAWEGLCREHEGVLYGDYTAD